MCLLYVQRSTDHWVVVALIFYPVFTLVLAKSLIRFTRYFFDYFPVDRSLHQDSAEFSTDQSDSTHIEIS